MTYAVIDNTGTPYPVSDMDDAIYKLASIARHREGADPAKIRVGLENDGVYRIDDKPCINTSRFNAAVIDLRRAGMQHYQAMNRHLDGINQTIADEAQAARLQAKRPLNGDWLVLASGDRRRLALVHDDLGQWEAQPTMTKGGSFTISKSGKSGFSGLFDDCCAIEPSNLHPEPAHFWFFDHGEAGANRAVNCMIRVNTWIEGLPF
ncbi:hypothetical protein [Thalassobius sp. Cn5-15]|uniref:hypothetical protein n=1 Tax=Thalassobius sp. Cn5-15 TaxID=2917763 RepID=UPI001EF3BC90|nr:hypothetical protein [Thalassobius sp. Cn5-15]MCG7492425.1 hypothetical protein [Thalassobius sp. Cn5-15]